MTFICGISLLWPIVTGLGFKHSQQQSPTIVVLYMLYSLIIIKWLILQVNQHFENSEPNNWVTKNVTTVIPHV